MEGELLKMKTLPLRVWTIPYPSCRRLASSRARSCVVEPEAFGFWTSKRLGQERIESLEPVKREALIADPLARETPSPLSSDFANPKIC